jgi:S-adenosylmethionine hydrolase
LTVAARSGIVTLTTDFGPGDPYAAALEAALLKVWSPVRVVHVSHTIDPGDIRSGAYVLEYATQSFPPGTVHLGVVDPGVGTDRPMLAIETETFVLVGPGNGLLDRALRGQVVHESVALSAALDRASRTFQSRDVMAPAAARAAAGEAMWELGSAVEIPAPQPASTLDWEISGTYDIAYVDRFGTLIIDVVHPGTTPAAVDSLTVAGRRVTAGNTFADVAPGELVVYRGSIGYVEVAVRDGSAAARLGVKAGDRISIGPG